MCKPTLSHIWTPAWLLAGWVWPCAVAPATLGLPFVALRLSFNLSPSITNDRQVLAAGEGSLMAIDARRRADIWHIRGLRASRLHPIKKQSSIKTRPGPDAKPSLTRSYHQIIVFHSLHPSSLWFWPPLLLSQPPPEARPLNLPNAQIAALSQDGVFRCCTTP